MKILFAGTPEFARESLEALVAAGFTPAAVLTQPDRPAGRGKQLAESPVKKFAQQHGIPVWQPATFKNNAAKDGTAIAKLAAEKPDLLIVAAYGLLLPQTVLDIPRRGCVNVHASLLPRWRGASPIQASILAGDTHTGVSLMQMEAGLDSGPVIAAESLPIGPEETAGSLHDRLAVLGGSLLVGALPGILQGTCTARPQNPHDVTFAGKIRTEDALLDWRQPAEINARKVRAYNPEPGAWFRFGDERIKCWSAKTIEAPGHAAGTVIAARKDGIDVACSAGALRLTEVQRAGGRRVRGGELAAQLKLSGKRLL
jgi:methionyl-tRNA formyltransferase